jgi:hypothetical protein
VRAHAGNLGRMMAALARTGVFTEPQPGVFALTPLGECLRSNAPRSLRWMAAAQADPAHWLPWGRADRAVVNGTAQGEAAMGMPLWQYLERNPEEAERFGRAMSNLSAACVEPIVAAHDFSRYKKIVDVGGGHGVMLQAVLQAAPQAHGVLFDLPGVVDSARSKLAGSPALDRIEVHGGSFFDEVPAGGDAYILKHIVHDWNDERAGRILQCCRQAIAPEGRLLVCEMVMSEQSPPFTFWLDVHMMVLLDGKERSREQFAQLFASAGFELSSITPTRSPYCIVEARPV